MRWQFTNKTKGTLLADNARIASSFLARLRGLLLTRSLPKGDGLYLQPCNSIHMFGMTYEIDCVFVDKAGVVVGLIEAIKPGKMSRLYSQADACLELPPGTISDTKTETGDLLEWTRNDNG